VIELDERLAALGQGATPTLTATFPRGDSAVLLLIVRTGTTTGIVLTRRSADLRTDPGVVAFPGGRIEAGESPENAARREASEEVGLSTNRVTIHGRLPESWNGAGFRIIPVVASIEGLVDLSLQESEVSAAAIVPLAAVIADSHHNTVIRTIDHHDFVDDIITFTHADREWELYGPTADIARDLSAHLADIKRDSITRRQADIDHFAPNRWA